MLAATVAIGIILYMLILVLTSGLLYGIGFFFYTRENVDTLPEWTVNCFWTNYGGWIIVGGVIWPVTLTLSLLFLLVYVPFAYLVNPATQKIGLALSVVFQNLFK